MLPEVAQASPPRGGATVAPPTTNTTATQAPLTRPQQACKQYISGWINGEFECARQRAGVKCPFYHDAALREVAIVRKKKNAEKIILEQQGLVAQPGTLQENTKPDLNALQSLPPSQVEEASKAIEKSHVASQQQSSTPSVPPNKSPDGPLPFKQDKACWRYAKHGNCKLGVWCPFRHVEARNRQAPEGKKVEGANVELSLASSKVALPSKYISHGAVQVQSESKAISPQLPIGTPPPQSQNESKSIVPIGTPSPQGKPLQEIRSDDISKKTLVNTDAAISEKITTDSVAPIVHESVQTSVAGSEPLDKAHGGESKAPEICRFYKMTGICRYNNRCHRSHDVIPDNIPAKDQLAQSSTQPSHKLSTPTQKDIKPPMPPVSSTSDIRDNRDEQLAVQPPQKKNIPPVHSNVQVSMQAPITPSSAPRQQSTHTNKRYCYAFADKGRCRLGDNCPYPHVAEQNPVQRAQVQRFIDEINKKQTIMSSSPDITEECVEASRDTTLRASQDVRLEFPQRPNQSFVRGSQDIREEFANFHEKSENTILKSSRDIRQDVPRETRNLALKGSQDIRKELPQMPGISPVRGSQNSSPVFAQPTDTAFMRGSQGTNRDASTSIVSNSVPSQDSRNEPPQTLSKSFVRGSDLKSVPAKVAEDALSQNVEIVSPIQKSGNGALSQQHNTPPSFSRQKVGVVCRYYSTRGRCRHGSACDFSHEMKDVVTKAHTPTVSNGPLTENKNSANKLPVKSESSVGKKQREPKKKINPWKKPDSLEIHLPAPTWSYSCYSSTVPPVQEEVPVKVDNSSYAEVAKYPSQKSNSARKHSGPIIREKRFVVPKVLCKQDCVPIEALPYNPEMRVTDLGHGDWEADYTLLCWLKHNLKPDKRAEIFARYRQYLERGVLPLLALEGKRDLKPNVNLACFSLLPNEIKEKIWRYAVVHTLDVPVKLDTWDTLIEDEHGKKVPAYYNRVAACTLTPPLLRTCSLSRSVALKHYKLAFATRTKGKARIYIDFKRDRVFIRHPNPNQLVDLSISLHKTDLSRIRNLGVPLLHWYNTDNDIFYNAIAQFRNLRELSLVVGDDVNDQEFWKGRDICPFLGRKLHEVWGERYPGVGSPGVYVQVIGALRARHWGIDGIRDSPLVCGGTDYVSKWGSRLKRG